MLYRVPVAEEPAALNPLLALGVVAIPILSLANVALDVPHLLSVLVVLNAIVITILVIRCRVIRITGVIATIVITIPCQAGNWRRQSKNRTKNDCRKSKFS